MGIEEMSIVQEHIARMTAVLERAVTLYKENPKKGEVYIVGQDLRRDQEEWSMRTKIADIVEGYAVTPEGEKIPLWSINEVEMLMADEE